MAIKLNVPRFELCDEHDFVSVKFGADIVVSKIVALVPAPDVPDDYFNLAGTKNETTVRALLKAPDFGGFVLEVATRGVDCESRIDATVQDIVKIANVWQNPEEAAKVFYRQ